MLKTIQLIANNNRVNDLLGNSLNSVVPGNHSGVQGQGDVLVKGKPLRTVSRALEGALKCLHPSNEVKITLSSRTDKGVHALKNACHVNLEYPSSGQEYNPLVITNIMNNYFMNQEEDIRVLQTRKVPDTFHSRYHARQRHYVYRLGHIREPDIYYGMHDPSYDVEAFFEAMRKFAPKKTLYPKLPFGEQLPILDTYKAVIYRDQLDISKLIKAAEMVSGIHNYLPFTSKRNVEGTFQPHPMKMLTIGVKRGQPIGYRMEKYGLDVTRGIEFWDIHVQSRSFLYKQIRKLVGTMVLVAKNKLSLTELQDVLNNPDKTFSMENQIVAKESGLFLLNVDYNPKDLEFPPADSLSDQQYVPEHSIAAITQSQDKESSLREDDGDNNTESDTYSEDDVLTSAVSKDKISSDFKLARSFKEMTDSS